MIDVAEDTLYASGLRYEDLVAAVDVVMTKPGYGIVSECVANRTAMLYTSRGRFAEYDVMVSEMPRYLRCRHLEQADLFSGRWGEGLDAVYRAAAPPEQPSTNGAEVIATETDRGTPRLAPRIAHRASTRAPHRIAHPAPRHIAITRSVHRLSRARALMLSSSPNMRAPSRSRLSCDSRR